MRSACIVYAYLAASSKDICYPEFFGKYQGYFSRLLLEATSRLLQPPSGRLVPGSREQASKYEIELRHDNDEIALCIVQIPCVLRR